MDFSLQQNKAGGKMIKSILVIAPHQDDEINLVGSVSEQIRKNGIHLSVIFATNGDYDASNSVKRYKETRRALNYLGVNKVIFLGYGDTLNPPHIYHSNSDVIVSHAGKTETYGVLDSVDFRKEKSGFHSKYTKDSFYKDLKEAVLDCNADLIISVDCDRHPDHKLCSLAFDTIMKEILVDNKNYSPIILKRFAYFGTWFGKNDYFASPINETQQCIDDYENHIKTKDVAPYLWSRRIRLLSDTNILLMRLNKSYLYKSLKCYKSQLALLHFPRIANSDTVFWYKDTNNLSLNANIIVSSGEKKYLNDFKLVDYLDICDRKSIVPEYGKCAWIPETNDKERTIRFRFEKKCHIKNIIIHQSLVTDSYITKICISNNLCSQVFLLERDIINSIDCDYKDCFELVFKIIETDGLSVGIREIEIFDHKSVFPWNETPFKCFSNNLVPIITKKTVFIKKIYYFVDSFFCARIPAFYQKIMSHLRKRKIKNES